MYKVIAIFVFLLISDVGSLIHRKDTIVDKVDMIELNHRYDDAGKHCYDQYLFWEWSVDYKRYHIVAWTLDEQKSSAPRILSKNDNRYTLTFYDRGISKNRKVIANVFRETETQYDPERENKNVFDEKYRRGLSKK
jgi:hypothetical protein